MAPPQPPSPQPTPAPPSGTTPTPPVPQPPPAPATPPTRSVFVGILLLMLGLVVIFGAIAAVLGLGGTSALDLKISDDFQIKTQSVGFGIMALGLLGIVGLIKFMPAHIVPFAGPPTQEPLTRMKPRLLAGSAVTAIVAIVLAILDH